ncbi:MAG: hypothetical protein AB1646_16625 [Thermodesulfobacteriota bacterium]
MEFVTACVIAVALAALLNLSVLRIRSRKPVVPEWVAGMRFQSGRRIVPADRERFGVMLEKQDQDKSRRVVPLFSGRKFRSQGGSDEPGDRT